jgi:hypothetical protein
MNRKQRLPERLGHHHHTWTTAIRTIINGTMHIIRKVAWTPSMKRPNALVVRAPRHTQVTHHAKHFRKQGDDVNAHHETLEIERPVSFDSTGNNINMLYVSSNKRHQNFFGTTFGIKDDLGHMLNRWCLISCKRHSLYPENRVRPIIHNLKDHTDKLCCAKHIAIHKVYPIELVCLSFGKELPRNMYGVPAHRLSKITISDMLEISHDCCALWAHLLDRMRAKFA